MQLFFYHLCSCLNANFGRLTTSQPLSADFNCSLYCKFHPKVTGSLVRMLVSDSCQILPVHNIFWFIGWCSSFRDFPTFATWYFWCITFLMLFLYREVKNRCGLRQPCLVKQQVVVFFFRCFNSLNKKRAHSKRSNKEFIYFGYFFAALLKAF